MSEYMSKHLKFEERLITFIKFEQMLIIFATIIHKMFETNSCMFPCKTAHYGENWFSVFQQIYSSTDKIFISGGGLSTRQQFYEVFRFFWYFLISWFTNNHASFLLLGMKNLLHPQKVSKYYELDCLENFILFFMSIVIFWLDLLYLSKKTS